MSVCCSACVCTVLIPAWHQGDHEPQVWQDASAAQLLLHLRPGRAPMQQVKSNQGTHGVPNQQGLPATVGPHGSLHLRSQDIHLTRQLHPTQVQPPVKWSTKHVRTQFIAKLLGEVVSEVAVAGGPQPVLSTTWTSRFNSNLHTRVINKSGRTLTTTLSWGFMRCVQLVHRCGLYYDDADVA